MKIVGNTVGMGLPKPDMSQTDPSKGDFVKNKDKIQGTFIGDSTTPYTDYAKAYSEGKAVFHKVPFAGGHRNYLASMIGGGKGEFYCVADDGVVYYAVLENDKWTYGTAEAGDVFIGDETTTLAEFYEAYRNKKACFMIRPMGGSGNVTWTMSSASSSNAHFFTITSAGSINYGYLSSVGDWTVSSKQDIDLNGYATEEWVQEGYQPKGNYLTKVPDGYAKTDDIPTKPGDIGAQPAGNYALKSEIPNAPVQSVNGKTGAVQLRASDVGADPDGTAAGAVSGHNTDTDSHGDLRLELKALTDRLNAFFDSDNQTLDELSEIVAYITSNKALIDAITTSKVNVSDVINNLTTNVANKPLSAAQGVVLKSLVDGLQSGKLDASALTAAINTALAQAKASGEFDGAAGKDGLDATPVAPLFANSIEECTDTSKFYVLPDGFIYAYMPSAGPSYTNLAGNVTYDRRLSSSGKASSSAMSGAAYTDFIPVKKGQIVRIENFDIYSDFSSSAFPYVCFYTGASENNVVSSTPYVRPADLKTEFSGVTNSVNGDLVTWTAFKIAGGAQHSLADSITHIRISGKYFADKEIIVTVDEEITEGGSGGYAWQSTGHAFVPADYEAEILALQKNKADKTAIPTKLPNPNALTIDGVPYDGSTAVNIETQSGGNILYGKKWVACGDSFTHGGYNASDGFDSSVYVYQDGRFAGQNIVYPYIIGLRNNMNIVNLATGGQTMAQSSNSFMTRYANIDADADYITIMLGINDKLQNIPVGNLDDAVNTTFCGAFNIAMEHILENHPFAHIGIMVSNGTNEEIMEATRGIAERWGVPYLDYGSPQVPLMNRYTGKWESEGGKVCTKAREIREKNFCVISDGTNATNSHPNTAAHEYESTFIEAWLRML